MFSRSQIRLLKALTRPMALKEITRATGISNSRASEIVKDLAKKRFLEKSDRTIYWSQYPHSRLFREILHSSPSIDFENFLYGKRMNVLMETCFSGGKVSLAGKNVEMIAGLSHTTRGYAENILYALQKRGLVRRDKDFWHFNNKLWPQLADFLIQYKEFVTEDLITVPRGEKFYGTPTGFSAYPEHGILVYPKADLYYTGREKLSAEEVFVHSLHQVNDERTRRLAREFLKKNKMRMNMKHVKSLAEFYGLAKALEEVLA